MTANSTQLQRVFDSFAQQPAMQTIGAKLVDVKPGSVSIELPFSKKLTQQHGFLHAGVISTLLDSACGYAAFSLMPEDAEVLSVEFKINLLRPAVGQLFRADAKVIRSGRTISVCDATAVAIDQGKEKDVAHMVGTMMAVRDQG